MNSSPSQQTLLHFAASGVWMGKRPVGDHRKPEQNQHTDQPEENQAHFSPFPSTSWHQTLINARLGKWVSVCTSLQRSRLELQSSPPTTQTTAAEFQKVAASH